MNPNTTLLEVPRTPALRIAELGLSEADDAARALTGSGLCVRRLRGKKMRTTPSLMNEVAAALQFPYYFGENWPALDECLSDMAWLLPTKSIVLLALDPSEVLVDEPPSEIEALVDSIRSASVAYAEPVADGEWWDRPAVPFHFVLVAEPSGSSGVADRWAAAGATVEQLAL